MLRRHRRGLLWAAGALVFLWLAAAGLLALQARTEATRAMDELDQARDAASLTELLSPGTSDHLEAARSGFARARSRLANPIFAPVRIVPVLGRQVRATEGLLDFASKASTLGRDTVAELRGVVGQQVDSGPERVAAAKAVARTAANARAELRDLDPGRGGGLVGPLRSLRDEVADAKGAADEGLDHAQAVAGTLARLLEGPHRYLLLAANNAEMRAGSGMFLSAGPLDFQGGRFDLGEMRPTRSLVLPKGTVPVTGDLARNWTFLDPAGDLRNLGLTPDFPTSAALAQRMWAKLDPAHPVEGVLAVDVEAVQDLLGAVGPVTVGDTRYTVDNVKQELLYRQYKDYSDNDQRTDRLADVAQAVLDRLEAGRWKLDALATALVDSVQGRHLLLWSADRGDQATWRSAAAAGELTEGSLAVSILNRGANKLDQFLTDDTAVRTRVVGGRTRVTVRVTLRNTTPPGQPRYIGGPNERSLVAGEYAGIVTLVAPGSAEDLALDGGQYLTMRGRDGPATTIGSYVRVRPGATLTLTGSFTLPGRHGRLTFEPSARLPHAAWSFDGEKFEVERRRHVHW